jgi:preprotein translocase subunit Sss1
MISPQLGRTAFRIAFMMVAVSAVMLLVLTPGTAEFLVSILTLILGLIFVGIIMILVRVLR